MYIIIYKIIVFASPKTIIDYFVVFAFIVSTYNIVVLSDTSSIPVTIQSIYIVTAKMMLKKVLVNVSNHLASI